MVERGFHFQDTDVDKSEASNFVIEDSLIAPFRAIQGLGLNVANKIVEEDKNATIPYRRKIWRHGKVSKTLLTIWQKTKVLDHLPDETNYHYSMICSNITIVGILTKYMVY